VPLRRCIACGEQRPKREMVRVVRTPDGRIDVGAPPKAAGRGAYVCRTQACLSKAAEGKALRRALELPVPEDAAALLREMAQQAPTANRDVSC
jgi:predicted RNA-binding protein YlxR (DUF448 family)